ncbi:MAG TPA: GAF domain-containing protein [Streptosporangiaceae bacterium]|nr:GAF domain-containing protein [Streptosporangiaceae bacterium]
MRPLCALSAGCDLRRYARQLSGIWDESMAGRRPRGRPRPVIADSWRRARRGGLDPWAEPEVPRADPDDIERRRKLTPLGDVLELLSLGLASCADAAVHVMTIVDDEGHVLWREGSPAVRRRADRAGLVVGSVLRETTVGTTGVGTALAVQRPLQVFAAEHFVRTLHPWVCTAAPVRDPVDGRLLGVLDVSGPAATAHPNTLALVCSMAKHAEAALRSAHRDAVEQLRQVAAPLLARIGQPAIVADRNGWVAAATGVLPPERVLLPEAPRAGLAHVAPVGLCQLEPLYDGWLIRLGRDEPDDPTTVRLDLRAAPPLLLASTPSGTWRYVLSPRQAEVLFLLARSPGGYSAAELSAELYGDTGHAVAIRSQLSRLRARLGSLISHRPYRFHPSLEVSCDLPDDPADLLPAATAGPVRELRRNGLQPLAGA